ncbi:MAG: hypothetical protein JSR53_04320 [Proteobacteria bacterium]|nr:hypothetical protein [Pseudomonadota bacterium]
MLGCILLRRQVILKPRFLLGLRHALHALGRVLRPGQAQFHQRIGIVERGVLAQVPRLHQLLARLLHAQATAGAGKQKAVADARIAIDAQVCRRGAVQAAGSGNEGMRR